MENPKVIILPEVRMFIRNLPDVLFERGYKINRDFAKKYKNELVDFIYKIPYSPSYKISSQFEDHFLRYGRNLRYAFYKRGSTTWYIFYQMQNNTYLVRHISNNWIDGQYIR